MKNKLLISMALLAALPRLHARRRRAENPALTLKTRAVLRHQSVSPMAPRKCNSSRRSIRTSRLDRPRA